VVRLLLLLLALGLAFVLWPRPTEAPKEAGVRLYGVAFHLFPEEEGVEWRFRAEEMVEEEGWHVEMLREWQSKLQDEPPIEDLDPPNMPE